MNKKIILGLVMLFTMLIGAGMVSAASSDVNVTDVLPDNDQYTNDTTPTITMNITNISLEGIPNGGNITVKYKLNGIGGFNDLTETITVISNTSGAPLFIGNQTNVTIPGAVGLQDTDWLNISVDASNLTGSDIGIATYYFKVTVDTTAPTVDSIATNGTTTVKNVTNQTIMRITASINDSGANLTTVTIGGNGTEMAMSRSGDCGGGINFTVDTNATALGCTIIGGISSTCTLSIIATDNASNANRTQTINILVDDQSPALSSEAVNGSSATKNVTSTEPIRVNVTIDDGSGSGVDSLTVKNSSSVTMTRIANSNNWYALTNGSALGCPEGICKLAITATDRVGHINTTTNLTYFLLNISVDDRKPNVTSVSINMTTQNVTSSEILNITTTVYDKFNGSNITSVILSVNGTGTEVTMDNMGDENYSAITNATTLGCVESTCILNVTATDYAGNVNATESITLIVDDTAPAVTTAERSPSAGGYSTSTQPTVYVNITDTGSGINTSSITMMYQRCASGVACGTSWSSKTVSTTAITNGFQAQITLDNIFQEGDTANITLNVSDGAGNNISSNTQQHWWNFTIDTANPAVTAIKVNGTEHGITMPTVNVTNTTNINISVDVQDSGSGVDSVTVKNASTITMSQIGSTNIYAVTANATTLGCSEGNCTLIITATDKAARTNTSETSFIFVDTLTANVSNIAINNSAGTDWFNLTSSEMLNITVEVDDSNGSNISSLTIGKAGTHVAIVSINASKNYSLADKNLTTLGCTTEGNCTLVVNATDYAGNMNNSETIIVRADDTVPAVTNILVNGSSTVYVNSSELLNLTVDLDDDSGTRIKTSTAGVIGSSVILEYGSKPLSGKYSNKTVNATTLGCTNTSGACAILINATDYAGNTNASQVVTIIVDNSRPNVTSVKLNNTAQGTTIPTLNVTTTAIINISATLADGRGSNLSTVTAGEAGAANVVLQQQGTSNIWYNNTINSTDLGCTNTTTGTCRIVINATDRAGNKNNVTSTAETILYIDTAKPNVTGISINGTDSFNLTSSEMINITAIVNDSFGSNISTVTVGKSGTTVAMSLLFGASNYSLGGKNLTTLGCTTEGNCTLVVTATDYSGNINSSETIVVRVDDTVPEVSNILVNGTSTVYVNSTEILNVTVDLDDDSGTRIQTMTVGFAGTNAILEYASKPLSGKYYNKTITAANLGCTNTSGTCPIKVTATDYANNSNASEILTIVVDDHAPNVTSIRINGSACGTSIPTFNVTSSTMINLSVTIDDNNTNGSGSGFAAAYAGVNSTNVQLSQDGSKNYSKITNATSLGCAGAATGYICTLYVNVSDRANNTNATETTLLIVDDTEPTIVFVGVNDSDRNVSLTDSIHVNFSVDDFANGSNISSVTIGVVGHEVTLVRSNVTRFNATTTATALGCGAGTCTILVNATDFAGNSNTTMTTAFTLAVIVPALETWTYNATTKNLTLYFNATMDAGTLSAANLAKINITYSGGYPYYGTGSEGVRHLSLGNGSVTDVDATLISITLNTVHDVAIRNMELSGSVQLDMGTGALQDIAGSNVAAKTSLARTAYTDWRIRRVLSQGWASFSLSMYAIENATNASTLANTNVTNVLASIVSKYQIIYAYNKTSTGAWLSYDGDAASSNFQNFSSETDSRAYEIYMNTSDVIEIS